MFDPYEWHEHWKPGQPRWRVKQGMAKKREALIKELQQLNDVMEFFTSFLSVDRWGEVHSAILACEENEGEVTCS